jgi:hypothetical protein
MNTQARRRQRGTGGAGVGCVMEGKAGSSRLLWRTSDLVTSDLVTDVRVMQFGPGIVSKNSIVSEKKQPFMMDFSASGFTNQRLCDV